MDRIPAETFSPGEFIADELEARGWSLDDFHRALGNDPVTCCAADLALFSRDKDIILDGQTAAAIGRALGTSGEFWVNLDRAWRGI